MKVGDRVKFDHMGKEHSGIITALTSSSGELLSHDVVHVLSDSHVSQVTINTTLFPERIREDEDRRLSNDSTRH